MQDQQSTRFSRTETPFTAQAFALLPKMQLYSLQEAERVVPGLLTPEVREMILFWFSNTLNDRPDQQFRDEAGPHIKRLCPEPHDTLVFYDHVPMAELQTTEIHQRAIRDALQRYMDVIKDQQRQQQTLEGYTKETLLKNLKTLDTRDRGPSALAGMERICCLFDAFFYGNSNEEVARFFRLLYADPLVATCDSEWCVDLLSLYHDDSDIQPGDRRLQTENRHDAFDDTPGFPLFQMATVWAGKRNRILDKVYAFLGGLRRRGSRVDRLPEGPVRAITKMALQQ